MPLPHTPPYTPLTPADRSPTLTLSPLTPFLSAFPVCPARRPLPASSAVHSRRSAPLSRSSCPFLLIPPLLSCPPTASPFIDYRNSSSFNSFSSISSFSPTIYLSFTLFSFPFFFSLPSSYISSSSFPTFPFFPFLPFSPLISPFSFSLYLFFFSLCPRSSSCLSFPSRSCRSPSFLGVGLRVPPPSCARSSAPLSSWSCFPPSLSLFPSLSSSFSLLSFFLFFLSLFPLWLSLSLPPSSSLSSLSSLSFITPSSILHVFLVVVTPLLVSVVLSLRLCRLLARRRRPASASRRSSISCSLHIIPSYACLLTIASSSLSFLFFISSYYSSSSLSLFFIYLSYIFPYFTPGRCGPRRPEPQPELSRVPWLHRQPVPH